MLNPIKVYKSLGGAMLGHVFIPLYSIQYKKYKQRLYYNKSTKA